MVVAIVLANRTASQTLGYAGELNLSIPWTNGHRWRLKRHGEPVRWECEEVCEPSSANDRL